MNNQNQSTVPKVFTTIYGNSLMAREYETLQFAIDTILPTAFSSLREARKSASHG